MTSSLPQLFQTSLNQHSATMLGLAFVGGVVSSLLPCTVGMLPILVGYVGGYAERSRKAVLIQILLFMLGFAAVLTGLGMLASALGAIMASLVGAGWYYFLGVIAIIMGLQLLEVIQIPLPPLLKRLPSHNLGRLLTPFILGAAFGAASSPCGTPFLTAILAFITRENSWLLGGLALFFYALGQSMLLLVVGLFTDLLKQMAVLRRVGNIMTKLSAGVFILAGLLMIAQTAGWLNSFAFY